MSKTATHVGPHGTELKLVQRGDGPPLLLLHEGTGLVADAPFLASLAESHQVIAPVHPGFDRTERPADFDSVDDLAYAESIPGARFEVIQGAAHLPHLEQPEAFVELVGGFLHS